MDLNGFKQYLLNLDSSPLTIDAYCQDIKLFSVWFEQTNGQELTPQLLTSMDVRDFKQYQLLQRHARPATINRKLASLRMYIKWSLDTNQISYNPITSIKSVAEQKLSPKWLTKIEQAALMREAERQILASHTPTRLFESQRNRVILILMSNTGVRLTELVSLELQDIQMTDRKGQLTIRNGKGTKTRIIPLNNSARKALVEWLQIRPEHSGSNLFVSINGDLGQRAVQEIFRGFSEKIHVHVTPHSLRHTFAKNLIDTGQVSLDKVGICCGHKSLNSTKIYCFPSLTDLQASLNLLDD